MMLYIMRHGIAEDVSPTGEDDGRRLTPAGREKIREAASGMRALGLSLDLILTSPLARAAQTAEAIAAAFGHAQLPEVLPELATGNAPTGIASALRHFDDRGDVMLVGHEPSLSQLASLLLTGSPKAVRIRLKKGGCVALEFPDGLNGGKADLRWMLTQGQLRRVKK